MSPIAQSDGGDLPGLVDEAVPGEATVVEDVLVGFEDAIGQPVVPPPALPKGPRMNCQMFSTGFSSGDFAGSGNKVMFSGTGSLAVVCQPAWSSRMTA
jgi:hypothetical protein